MGIKIKVNIDANKAVNRIINRETRLFATTTAAKLMDPYVPMNSGSLATLIDIQPGIITYKSPYARFLYYGKLMLDERGSSWAKKDGKKYVVNKDLNFNTEWHSLATSKWDRAMMASQKDTFLKAIQDFIDGRNK